LTAGTNDFADDPLFKLLNEMKSGMGGLSGGAIGDGSQQSLPSNPLEAFQSLFGDDPLGAVTDGSQTGMQLPQEPKRPDFWPSLHTALVFMLSLFVCMWQERPDQLIWMFCTLEIALIAGRFVVERGAPPDSTIAKLAGFLPNPFRGYIVLGSRYLHILRVLWRDLCIALFVLALCCGSESRIWAV
jgi:hypothetical protein